MDELDSANLLRRYVATDDQVAASELFNRYANRLIEVAGKQMSGRMKQRVGPDDVVQSVYNSFFLKAKAGSFTLDGSGHLWPLLVSLTINKIRNLAQHISAGKRNARQERPMDDCSALLSSQPSPQHAASLCEEVERLLRHFDGKATQQRIVELYLQGESIDQIALKVGRGTERVRQVLRTAQQLLEEGLRQA